MTVLTKQTDDQIKVKQYIIDAKVQKVAAVLDIGEFARVNDLIEDLIYLKTIGDRVAEPAEDYEAYSRKRKSRLHVRPEDYHCLSRKTSKGRIQIR